MNNAKGFNMLFGVINKKEDFRCIDPRVDGVEVRLDLFAQIDLEELRHCLSECHCDVLLTLRRVPEHSEEERLALLEALFALRPAYIDLEWDTSAVFVEKMAQAYPETKIICSYHDFEKTPEDLPALLDAMRSSFAYAYKVATMARSSLDALRMVYFVRSRSECLTGICMGELGQLTRILGPVMGNFIDYALLAEASAPGQMDVETLCKTFRYKDLNLETKIYALIGNPVRQSISHRTHNRVFSFLHLNAVYVKIVLEESELSDFFSWARKLPFQGLSVTMPFKEQAAAYLDEGSGAINTVVFQEGKLIGHNTDGIGALQALQQHGPVEGRHVVLLGTGGAAKAIASQMVKQGARVTLVSRSLEKARQVASALGCEGRDCPPANYDILINCTPVGMTPNIEAIPLEPLQIASGALVLDTISSPRETALLREASKRGCCCVPGLEMFFYQALEQFSFWFSTSIRTRKEELYLLF